MRARGSISVFTQRFSAGLIGLGAVVLLFIGGSLLLSALNSWQAQRFIDDWAGAPDLPSPMAFATAEAAAIAAIKLHPGTSGAAWDRLGRVYDWANWVAPIEIDSRPSSMPSASALLERPLGAAQARNVLATRHRALVAHQQAVALRPLWPYGHARLAQAALRAGRLDAQMAGALTQAARLGPWRPGINRRVGEVGLIAWPSLDQATRVLVEAHLRRAMGFSRSDEARLQQLADQLGREGVLPPRASP
jgi:hypothetical protein